MAKLGVDAAAILLGLGNPLYQRYGCMKMRSPFPNPIPRLFNILELLNDHFRNDIDN